MLGENREHGYTILSVFLNSFLVSACQMDVVPNLARGSQPIHLKAVSPDLSGIIHILIVLPAIS